MGIDFKKNFACIELLFTTRHYLVKYTDDAGCQIEASVERTFEENVDRSGGWRVFDIRVDGEPAKKFPEKDSLDIINFVRESVKEKKV